MRHLPLIGVATFWVWLVVAVVYGMRGKDPAANPYKWLIGWPLGLVLLVAVGLYAVFTLPVRGIRAVIGRWPA